VLGPDFGPQHRKKEKEEKRKKKVMKTEKPLERWKAKGKKMEGV
jgi:hypothetical protein